MIVDFIITVAVYLWSLYFHFALVL